VDGVFETSLNLPAPVEEVSRHLTDLAAMVRWTSSPSPPPAAAPACT